MKLKALWALTALSLFVIGFLTGWQASPRSPGGLLPLTPEQWSSLAAWLGVAIAALAACYAGMQWVDARKLRREMVQPQVICYMNLDWTGTKNPKAFVSLVIRNIGPTTARDVKIDWNPDPMHVTNTLHYPTWEAVPFDAPSYFSSLAPGQEWRTVWDVVEFRQQLDELKAQDSYVVRITWRGHEDEPGNLETTLDWKPFRNVQALTTATPGS